MPAEFAQQRIRERFLQHRYTRVPRAQVAAPADYDDQGNPEPAMYPDAGAPAKQPGLACLFLAADSYIQAPGGLIQVDKPTLIVEVGSPLAVGDQVENIVDPSSGFLYLATARVENATAPSNAGPPIYLSFELLDAEVQ